MRVWVLLTHVRHCRPRRHRRPIQVEVFGRSGTARADGIEVGAVGLYPPPLLKWGGVYTLKWGGVYLYSPLVICAGGEYDGVDAASRAGGGAIDPVAERSGGLARVDGIGCSAIGQYSPPIFLIGGGQYDGFGATG
jgi:hypothetical protein